MLILVHRKMNVLYVWLVSSKYIHRLQSYGKSPITSGSPLVLMSSIFIGGINRSGSLEKFARGSLRHKPPRNEIHFLN